jgi:UDP-N-acetylglucosamine 1-carboxyvinyltransferase
MLLDEASVTGTANIVMAAVLAEGRTTIFNAACEPYLQQLCGMLVRMGAKITGHRQQPAHIDGVKELGGTEHRLLPDMIEIGSFIGLAAMTRSEITIKDTGYDHLGVIPEVFRKLGIAVVRNGDDIHVPAQEHYTITKFIDGSNMMNIRCTLARLHTGPAQHRARDRHTGERQRAHPPEDVREPPVLHR